MTACALLRAPKRLIAANALGTLIGIVAIRLLTVGLRELEGPEVTVFMRSWMQITGPIGFILIFGSQFWWEGPFRRHIKAIRQGKASPADASLVVKQRLLNEPFFLVITSFTVWTVLGVIRTSLLLHYGADHEIAIAAFIAGIRTGLITAAIIFFLTEHIIQSHLSPYVFPRGGQSKVPGTLRVTVTLRMTAVFVTLCLIPIMSFLDLRFVTPKTMGGMREAYDAVQFSIAVNGAVFLTTGLVVFLFVSITMKHPLKDIIASLRRVREGDFESRVSVTSNDEMGYTGDVINEMAEGLKERERMRHGLAVAMEVQRTLLPVEAPFVEGYDISGASIYCDETGGDYYDYMEHHNGVFIAVGDVSGHGIPAALLMVSARAGIRLQAGQRETVHCNCDSTLGSLTKAVNEQMFHDVVQTGQFMTLFCCDVNTETGELAYVRAGHDPPFLYDPASDSFQELDIGGLPLGVLPNADWNEGHVLLAPGQVLVIGTDGIWEAHDAHREQFGKERLKDIIREHATSTAEEIQEAILKAVGDYAANPFNEDDVTLVVLRRL